MKFFLKKIENGGFFFFILALFITAIGVKVGAAWLWEGALIVVALIGATVLFRARQSAYGRPKSATPAASPTSSNSKSRSNVKPAPLSRAEDV